MPITTISSGTTTVSTLVLPPDGYLVEGSGPPVLFVPGYTLDLTMWDLQVEALRDRFTCIRFDPRGAGRSLPTPPAPDNFRRVPVILAGSYDYGVPDALPVADFNPPPGVIGTAYAPASGRVEG